MRRAARRFGCSLAGGDTTERREVLINVTVVGEVRRGREVRRSGARPGDIIYVSGRLGEAELGLRLLRERKRGLGVWEARLRKHLYPEPRLELGRWLSEKRVASAMMDVSDGLSSDLRRLCEASRVGAVIRSDQLPTVRVTKLECNRGVDPLQLALHGGDDYELLFTVPKSKAKRLPRSMGGVAITPIGEITRAREVMVTPMAMAGHEFWNLAAGTRSEDRSEFVRFRSRSSQAGCGLPMVVLGGSGAGITGDTGTAAVRAGVKWR